jgi:hypothetical protein
MSKYSTLFIAFLISVSIIGCSKKPANVAGEWEGTYSSEKASSTPNELKFSLTQREDKINCGYSLSIRTEMNVLGVRSEHSIPLYGTASGEVSGNEFSVKFDQILAGSAWAFTGDIKGSTISGTYKVIDLLSSKQLDKGVFSIEKK